MTPFEYAVVILSIISILIIPLLVMITRGMTKWTRTEDKLEGLIEDVKTLVMDKDRTHRELYGQMREDRAATDRRLRWLEETLWKRGGIAP